MRPFLPYPFILILTVLCCGACILYNVAFRGGYASTLHYAVPPAQEESAAVPASTNSTASPSQQAERTDPGETPSRSASSEMSEEPVLEVQFPLNINLASEEELRLIPQVGDATAQRIVQYRDYLGGYSDLTQLLEIKGIGEKMFEHLYPYLYLDEAGDENPG